MPQFLKNKLPGLWHISLFLCSLFFLIGLAISVFGIPGVSDYNTILSVCWGFLFASLALINVTYISGYAFDIKRQY